MKKPMKKDLLKWLLILAASILILVIINLTLILRQATIYIIMGQNGLLVLSMGILIIYVLRFHRRILAENNKIFLYITLCIVNIIPSVLLANTVVYWLFPITIGSMIIAVMIDENLGIVTNLFMVLIISLVSGFKSEFILFFIISGTISCLLITKATERKQIVYVAIKILLINVMIYFLLSFVLLPTIKSIEWKSLTWVVINGTLSVIITIGSLPLLETIFSITTNNQLLELSTSNHKLLQRLMLEAPGTYHHSQMVAHLAETAASDIGANTILARTGALFHDIGKLKNPELFIENQEGSNPHDELSPDASASIILAHVIDGVKLANEYRLPKQIMQIIKQHQGDSLVKYFYDKALEHSDGFEIDEKVYRYSGPKHLTNEAAIVMLADCVEAYIRSMDDEHKSLDEIQNLIKYMINLKLEDGQLDDCPLKIKELPIIADAFKKVYNGMYHDRVTNKKE